MSSIRCQSPASPLAKSEAREPEPTGIVDRLGQIVADFAIKHSAAGWQRWGEQVAALGGAVAVCVETSQGIVIEQLLESGVSLYPISPVSSKAYRERKVPSGSKSDHLDAWSLADALRVDGHGWRALAEEDPLVAELRLLCRDEVALIEERTALVNQLQSALQEYYPAALEAFEDWTLPAAWAFLEAFPSPQALKAAGNRNGRRKRWSNDFFHAEGLISLSQCRQAIGQSPCGAPTIWSAGCGKSARPVRERGRFYPVPISSDQKRGFSEGLLRGASNADGLSGFWLIEGSAQMSFLSGRATSVFLGEESLVFDSPLVCHGRLPSCPSCLGLGKKPLCLLSIIGHVARIDLELHALGFHQEAEGTLFYDFEFGPGLESIQAFLGRNGHASR